MSDKVDAAIGRVEAPKPIEMLSFQIGLAPNQRPAKLDFPKDITDEEVCHLIGGLVEITNRLRLQRAAAGLWVPPGTEVRSS